MHHRTTTATVILIALFTLPACLFTGTTDDPSDTNPGPRDTSPPDTTSPDTQPPTDTADTQSPDTASDTDPDTDDCTTWGERTAYEVCSNGTDDNCDDTSATKGDTVATPAGSVECGTLGTPCTSDDDCYSDHCIDAPLRNNANNDPASDISICGARMFTTSTQFHGNMKTDEETDTHRSPDAACQAVAQNASDRSYADLDAIIDDGADSPFADAAPGVRSAIPVYSEQNGYRTLDLIVPAVRTNDNDITNVLTRNPIADFQLDASNPLNVRPDRNETGAQIDATSTLIQVWTGWNGNLCRPDSGEPTWSTPESDTNGNVGNANSKTANGESINTWLKSSTVGCGFTKRLFCIEQLPSSAASAP